MTIIFLAITVGVVTVALFTLIGAHGEQLTRSVTVLQSTVQPIAFASGSVEVKSPDGRTVLEQGIQALASKDRSLARGAARIVQSMLEPYGIRAFTITVKEQNVGLTSVGNIVKFCGNYDQKRLAYCNSGGCPAGSFEAADSNNVCSSDEKCCQEDYFFALHPFERYYNNVPDSLKCGVGAPPGKSVGVCQDICSPGRAPSTRTFSGCAGPRLVCCEPTGETKTPIEAANAVTIPIVYRQSPQNLEGKWGSIEIAVSQEGVIK